MKEILVVLAFLRGSVFLKLLLGRISGTRIKCSKNFLAVLWRVFWDQVGSSIPKVATLWFAGKSTPRQENAPVMLWFFPASFLPLWLSPYLLSKCWPRGSSHQWSTRDRRVRLKWELHKCRYFLSAPEPMSHGCSVPYFSIYPFSGLMFIYSINWSISENCPFAQILGICYISGVILQTNQK